MRIRVLKKYTYIHVFIGFVAPPVENYLGYDSSLPCGTSVQVQSHFSVITGCVGITNKGMLLPTHSIFPLIFAGGLQACGPNTCTHVREAVSIRVF